MAKTSQNCQKDTVKVLYAVQIQLLYSKYVQRYIGQRKISISNIIFIWKPKMQLSLQMLLHFPLSYPAWVK